MMIWNKLVLVFAFSAVVACCVTALLIPVLRKYCLDVPNSRSSHTVPTPRGGGLGILAGLVAGLIVARTVDLGVPTWNLVFGASLIAFIGTAEDVMRDIAIPVRLCVQIVAASLVAWPSGLATLPLPPPLDFALHEFAFPAAVIWIVAVVNIFNFLDGIDGFAATQALIVGLALAVVEAQTWRAGLAVAVAGGCCGFAVHNWHPAKVYMGDVGSLTLGFLIAAIPLQRNPGFVSDAVFICGLSLWFFLADGVFTIGRRWLNSEKVWTAHRSHLYQRVVRCGLRPDLVVMCVLVPGAVLAAVAVAAGRTDQPLARWIVLVLALVAFGVYSFWIHLWERRSQTERPVWQLVHHTKPPSQEHS